MADVVAKRVLHFDDLKEPGQFLYWARQGVDGHAGLTFLCPCGCGSHGGVQFHRGTDASGPEWTWDGNEEQPTVSPNIRKLDGCQWHGFLRNGVWQAC